MLKYLKILKNTPTCCNLNGVCLYVCTSLKLLNYLKNTEIKILKIIPGVVAAKRVAGVRGDTCGAVR